METEAEKRAFKRDRIMRAEYAIQDIRRMNHGPFFALSVLAIIPISSALANTLIG